MLNIRTKKLLSKFIISSMIFGAMCGSAMADEKFLDPSQAFKYSANLIDVKTIAVNFDIASGYAMYRDRFTFQTVGGMLGKPEFPKGKIKYDPTFKKNLEIYHDRVTIMIPVEAAGKLTLKVSAQGCSEKGLCYMPQDYETVLGANLKSHDSVGAAMSAAPGFIPSFIGKQ